MITQKKRENKNIEKRRMTRRNMMIMTIKINEKKPRIKTKKYLTVKMKTLKKKKKNGNGDRKEEVTKYIMNKCTGARGNQGAGKGKVNNSRRDKR